MKTTVKSAPVKVRKADKLELVETLPPAEHGNIQLLESGLMNIKFDGKLVGTLTQDKARKLATAILMALDAAAENN
jgi:hypothetical protein